MAGDHTNIRAPEKYLWKCTFCEIKKIVIVWQLRLYDGIFIPQDAKNCRVTYITSVGKIKDIGLFHHWGFLQAQTANSEPS